MVCGGRCNSAVDEERQFHSGSTYTYSNTNKQSCARAHTHTNPNPLAHTHKPTHTHSPTHPHTTHTCSTSAASKSIEDLLNCRIVNAHSLAWDCESNVSLLACAAAAAAAEDNDDATDDDDDDATDDDDDDATDDDVDDASACIHLKYRHELGGYRGQIIEGCVAARCEFCSSSRSGRSSSRHSSRGSSIIGVISSRGLGEGQQHGDEER